MSKRNWHTKVAKTISRVCFLNCMRSQRKINLELYLPREIVEEILCRLPVKSVLRFRCVAKSWNYFISSKKFIKMHFKKSAMNMRLSNPRFDVVRKHERYAYCTLKLYSPHSLFYGTCETYALKHRFDEKLYYSPLSRIVGYSNGLCCIREHNKDFILWNPSTRKSRKLPPIYNEEWMDMIWVCGFGYDETCDDYKILTTVKIGIRIIRLYSLKKNSWKTVQKTLPIDKLFHVQPLGVLVNGKLHWVSHFPLYGGSSLAWTWRISSFDLGSEAFGSVKLPSFVDHEKYSILGTFANPTLTVLDGSLCIRSCNQNDGTNIWIMKEYGVKESWCKLVTILHNVVDDYSDITPLCVSREGEILLLWSSSLIIYNPKENSCRRPKMKDTDFEPVSLHRMRHVDFYHESLVSPFPDGEGELQHE